MDVLTFIAALVESLAWPLATVVVAILFRKQLISLLARLRKGKVGPAEFEFEEGVRALEKEASDIPGTPSRVGTPTISLVTSNPRAAILEAWLEVEDQATTLALTKDLVRPTARRNPMGVLRGLESSDILSDEHKAILAQLRNLRNQAAHEPDFSPSADSVLSYVQLSRDLKNELERLSR